MSVCINHAPATRAGVWTMHRHLGRTGLNIQHAPAVSCVAYCCPFSPL